MKVKIRNSQPTLHVFDLPSGSLHLSGRGRAARGRDVAEVEESDIAGCPQLQKAIKKKWVRVLESKKTEAPVATPVSAPVAKPAPAVPEAAPNDSSDE